MRPSLSHPVFRKLLLGAAFALPIAAPAVAQNVTLASTTASHEHRFNDGHDDDKDDFAPGYIGTILFTLVGIGLYKGTRKFHDLVHD